MAEMVLKCSNFKTLAGQNCFFISHFWHFKRGLVSCPVPLLMLLPQPDYLSFLFISSYWSTISRLYSDGKPFKLPKMFLSRTPIILCIKPHFNTDCSCLILFAGTILNSCYFFTKCLLFLIGVNTSIYKWSGIHLQINPHS